MINEQFKSAIKSALAVLKIRPQHLGINLFDDIKNFLPAQRMETIFDVGANEGQTARILVRKFPSADIHCFEPNRECCEALRSLGRRIHVHQVGVGSSPSQMFLDRSNGQSDMFFLTDHPTDEPIKVETLDDLVSSLGIKSINFLKIDTEGFDLNVISGGANILAGQAVDLLQAEVSLNCENSYHVPFFKVQQAMEQNGYRLFGIYEQVFEWGKNAPYLRRANVVYSSPQVRQRNRLYAERSPIKAADQFQGQRANQPPPKKP